MQCVESHIYSEALDTGDGSVRFGGFIAEQVPMPAICCWSAQCLHAAGVHGIAAQAAECLMVGVCSQERPPSAAPENEPPISSLPKSTQVSQFLPRVHHLQVQVLSCHT